MDRSQILIELMSMTTDGYSGGATTGGKWGCAMAAIVGLPLIGFTIVASSLGDCVPNVPCRHPIIWEWMIPAILISAAVGLATRAVLNRLIDRGRKE